MQHASRKRHRGKNQLSRNAWDLAVRQIASHRFRASQPCARRNGTVFQRQASIQFSSALGFSIDSIKSIASWVRSDEGWIVHCPSGTKSMGRVSNGSVNIHSLASPITYAGCGKAELSG